LRNELLAGQDDERFDIHISAVGFAGFGERPMERCFACARE
jgi:hypothetical protein